MQAPSRNSPSREVEAPASTHTSGVAGLELRGVVSGLDALGRIRPEDHHHPPEAPPPPDDPPPPEKPPPPSAAAEASAGVLRRRPVPIG